MTQCPTPSISGGQDRSPLMDPSWEYQLGIIRRDHRMLCLVEDMKQCIISIIKPVNYDMVKKITQGQDENPALFQAQQINVLRKCRSMDPKTFVGHMVFATYSINHPGPIRHFRSLPWGPKPPAIVLKWSSVLLTIKTRLRKKGRSNMT